MAVKEIVLGTNRTKEKREKTLREQNRYAIEGKIRYVIEKIPAP